MAKKKDEGHSEQFQRGHPFEQVFDAHGRMHTDRPLTAEEAAAQDAAHRERFLAERRKRFQPTG